MSFEEPTQRIGNAADTTTALPGPLNLADDAGPRSSGPEADTTDVLSLNEIFDEQPPLEQPPLEQPPSEQPPFEQPQPGAGAAAEAPTWTAMPVVPVRSEPVRPAGQQEDLPRPGSQLRGRVRTDAAAAVTGGVRRTQDWFRRGDNALMLLTAVVAIILIVTVSALGA